MPLGIKGKFYANVPVLYLTRIFYVKNFGAPSLMCNVKGKCTHKGKNLCQYNLTPRYYAAMNEQAKISSYTQCDYGGMPLYYC